MRRLFMLVAMSTVLAGCVGAPAEQTPAAPVILPDKPGEPATVVPGDQVTRQQTAPNEADIDYVTMMIPHHRQAVVMTDLVPGRAQDEQVRAIAGRIAASQDAEITMMSSWLTGHGKPVPGGHDHAGHEPALMPGMATQEQLDALRAATGREFDRQFLDLMIIHHQGAVTMAERQLAHGVETKAQEMAQDVVTSQTAEIERMRAMRAQF